MSLAENYVIGMDCGTTNIKAIIMDDQGNLIAQASRPNRFLISGTDRQEQNALDWWENARQIFLQLTAQAGKRVTERIRGICISSHTVSLLPVDEKGQPLRNAITYQDSRSATELQRIVEKIGYERYVRNVAARPSVAFLPGKLLWYKEHEPEKFEKTKALLQASSYINFRLTGVMSSDVDQASRTQCLDAVTGEWSDLIGTSMNIDLKRILPKPETVDWIIGAVTGEAAKETGLKAGTPVLAGCSDAMASMYATGMSRLGEAGESSGTTSLVFAGSTSQSAPDLPVVTRPCAIEGMPWIFDAPIQTSGAALKWYIENHAEKERIEAEKKGINIYEYLNRQALEAKPGSNGLFFFPYLLGERAPLWNDYARAMWIGMGMNTTHAEMTRSVFEGTSYALRHVMETIKAAGAKADVLRICGGGARSETWCRIKAAMLHMPVYLLDENSGDVPFGDALIAGHRTGVFPDLTEAVKRIVKVKKIIEPDEAWARQYDELYPYYIDMYQALDQKLKGLREIVQKAG